VIAESALELVPGNLQGHSSVRASARRLGKKPSEILLDVSWHFAAMKGIENEIKRGRPDLVHICLLEASSIPLYFENKLSVYVHTIDDRVITLGRSVRLPKSYHRFAGLVEKMYADGRIEEGGQRLLEIAEMGFGELLEKIKPKQVVGLSSTGAASTYQKLAGEVAEDSCIVVGGFPKGHFSGSISKHFDRTVSVEKVPLEAHVIICRMLYELEKRIIT